MDVFSKQVRSRIMSRIRSKGNASTERRFRMLLVRQGITGWRMLPTDVTGRPDFAFPDSSLAIFVDGCFWHGCPKCYQRPANNREYWDSKLNMNITRDKRLRAKLRRSGWTVIQFWEHELDDPKMVAERIVNALGKKHGPRIRRN